MSTDVASFSCLTSNALAINLRGEYFADYNSVMTKAVESSPIKSLPPDDRPREKALAKGISALTNSELVAILLGSGSRQESALELARRLLYAAQNNLHKFSAFSIEELREFKGIGNGKAVTLAAALELGRRRMRSDRPEGYRVLGSSDVYDLMAPYMIDKDYEEVWLIMMNQAGKVIHHEKVSSGGMTGAVVDPKIVIRRALAHSTTRIILVHNHPSGTARPSRQDIQMTNKIRQAAALLDMQLTDHVIIARDTYFSFLDEGML